MNTFFEKNSERDFKNFIEYPLQGASSRVASHNCCGFAATGDPEATDPASPSDTTVKTAVRKVVLWNYAKTGLAIIGLYVAVKYILAKIK
jgi:hypothetical protein